MSDAPSQLDIDDEPTDPGSWAGGVVCQAGAIYATDFEVVGLVASGGMGEVYKVKHVGTGGVFAMKVMRPDLARDPAFVARFESEGRALQRFDHAGVVRAHQVGYDPVIGPYIVMELLDGMTLSDLMARYGRKLPMEQAIPILLEVASALELIHAQGIVHRDIKPLNIFLHKPADKPRETKVLDFGAMKAKSGSLHVSSTASGKAIGTPRYMAPEQLVAQPIGPFTDVYALGVVAYEIMSFSSLFGAQVEKASVDEVRMFHLFAPRIPLTEIVPELPPSLWDAIERATRREPTERTQTMQAFADDLKRAREDALKARAPDSDEQAVEVARARIAQIQREQAKERAAAAKQKAPVQATAYGLHLVDLAPAEPAEVDLEALVREREGLVAKLAVYDEARLRNRTLPTFSPVAVRKLLGELDIRIAAARRAQGQAPPVPSSPFSPAPSTPSGAVMAPPAFRLDLVTAPSTSGAQVRLGVLLGVTGPATGVDHHVGLVPLRIGRAPSCQVQLNDDDVSSVHATISRTAEGDFELLDADSTNGTRVNGAAVSRAVLQVGDRISIGSSVLEFRFFEPGERSPKRTRKMVSEPQVPAAVDGPSQTPPLASPFAENASSSPGVATHVPTRASFHGGSAGVLALLISFGTIVAAGFGGFWWSRHASISAPAQRALAACVALFRSTEPIASAQTSAPAFSTVPSARVSPPSKGPR